mgnify:CR=1 FL=1
MSKEEVVNKCLTCNCSGSIVYADIDNPGDHYCIKCWESYDADVAYKYGIHLVKENRFLSTQNAALNIVVATVLASGIVHVVVVIVIVHVLLSLPLSMLLLLLF